MSGKRSDRLRSMIAATVADAAENAAPVGVTGASLPISDKLKAGVKTLDFDDSFAPLPDVDSQQNAAQEIESTRDVVAAAPTRPLTPIPQGTVSEVLAIHAQLRAPVRPVKRPKWEKANVTLEPRDLTILERSDSQARSYGFRIRKGGNPSLFVRAGLRLLDDLRDRNPEEWVKRIAAMTSSESDRIE